MKKSIILASIFVLVISSAALADNCPDLVGTYKLTSASVNGQALPQNEIGTDPLVIEQNVCESISLTDPGNPSADGQFLMDGQPHQNAQGLTSIARFEGSSAVIKSSSASSPASVTVTFALSEDGKTLTETVQISNGTNVIKTNVLTSVRQ